ncbi:ZPR1 zinc-finger domain-containing protein [Fimicolochytrium jonesii]|uniref:ZPR1 zinc-finger domain-containing protein n=1 Tax=Fimicolochytrium jonesii TaxID=1396493 RepID=UPI0022FDE821|nr:ZPR1 zinc-finger domain-containing protein [Fimicolochytrium jonesii]KAI8827131.1 ZPR1 zinc-finger domain-containing protein [Fimicolochytrium jonesii]
MADTKENYNEADNSEVEAAPQGDLVIPRPCPICGVTINGKAALVEIPHFKEVAHLTLDCGNCGNKTESYKSGHRVEDKGTKMTLKMESKRDFERLVLKGEHCTMEIPSLGLEVPPEALPARYMSIADFLHQTLTDVLRHAQATGRGGNSDLKQWVQKMMAFMDGDMLPATLILTDPAGNTYLESFSAPEKDATIETEEYERSVADNKRVNASYDSPFA